jgi:hypothetical protein
MKILRQMKQEIKEIKGLKSFKKELFDSIKALLLAPFDKWLMFLISLCVLYLIIVFITIKKDVAEPSPVVQNMQAQINEHQQAYVKAALRETFASLTTENLIGVDLIDKFQGVEGPTDFTEVESLLSVRLKDGNLITIGYFDKKGNYRSLLK